MLQQAVREGFNPIYLVGVDLGYVPRKEGELDENHFSPEYHSRLVEPGRAAMDNETQIEMHQHAKDYADRNKIQILNATLGGDLEVYPRVNYGELFQ